MILLLSGEGPSDIGSCRTPAPAGICEGMDFNPGPMARFIDKLVAPEWGYSPLDVSSFVFITSQKISDIARDKKQTHQFLSGKKKPRNTGFFFKEAQALAILARDREKKDQCPVGAILFHDTDGTRSTAPGMWKEKVAAIENGFKAAQFELGVPMMPKPKSEAWLLCALRPNPYHNCEQLESISGNDNSPNSAKKQLDSALEQRQKTYSDVVDLIIANIINVQLINMPSFNQFKSRLVEVARQMARQR